LKSLYAENWHEYVASIMEQYAPQNIYNMDYTALFYNAQPGRTLAVKGKTLCGEKKCKDQLTLLLSYSVERSEI
jgi:hypothetical protein